MELIDVIKKFNFTNIIVLDNVNYFSQKVEDVIDDTLEIYQIMINKFGADVLKKEIIECDGELHDMISPYIGNNPYASIDRIKNDVNFKYISSTNELDICTLNEGNVLWFVDIMMNIPSNYNHISTLYNYFYRRNKDHNHNDIFILFSSVAQNYDDLEKIESFLRDDVKIDKSILNNSCVALNTNIIEKNDIDAQLIYYLILKSSKSKYFDFLNKIISDSIKRFKQNIYDSKTGLELFSYDYLTEGKNFDELLFDIFEFDLKTNYIHDLDYSMFSIMNEAVDYYLENNKTKTKVDKAVWRVKKVLNEIEHPSCVDVSINEMRHDVSFGDIFLIDDKYYMVGNQSCDIAIRANGTRIDSYATLIPILLEEYPNDKLKKYKASVVSKIIKLELKEDPDAFEKAKNLIKQELGIEYKSDQTNPKELIEYNNCVYSVEFCKNGMISFPFWCLDCVVCNPGGIVDFNYDSKGLRFPLKKRIESAQDEYKKLESLKIDNYWDFLSNVYCFGNKISSITRIGKVNSDLSNYLYNEFLAHKSRISKDKITRLTN